MEVLHNSVSIRMKPSLNDNSIIYNHVYIYIYYLHHLSIVLRTGDNWCFIFRCYSTSPTFIVTFMCSWSYGMSNDLSGLEIHPLGEPWKCESITTCSSIDVKNGYAASEIWAPSNQYPQLCTPSTDWMATYFAIRPFLAINGE